MEPICVCRCLLKQLIVFRFLMAGGRKFHTDLPKKVYAGTWWMFLIFLLSLPTHGPGEELENVIFLLSLPTHGPGEELENALRTFIPTYSWTW